MKLLHDFGGHEGSTLDPELVPWNGFDRVECCVEVWKGWVSKISWQILETLRFSAPQYTILWQSIEDSWRFFASPWNSWSDIQFLHWFIAHFLPLEAELACVKLAESMNEVSHECPALRMSCLGSPFILNKVYIMIIYIYHVIYSTTWFSSKNSTNPFLLVTRALRVSCIITDLCSI